MPAIAARAGSQQPLPTTREERGRQIALRGGICQLGARYVVPAQSNDSAVPTYLVDIVEQTCTCPDYELRRESCKHQEAVLYWLAWEGGTVSVETSERPRARKQQSKQNWPAYNRAQTTERLRVPKLLHVLLQGVPNQDRVAGTPGQKPIPEREAAFGLAMKVYSGCSGRRAEADMHAYVAQGLLSRAWDSNTLFRAMESPAMTPILTWAVEESGGPIAQIENVAGQFCVDATGFRMPVRRLRDEVAVERWYDQKREDQRRKETRFVHEWMKLHAACGALTNIVTAARVTAGMGVGAGDSPHFRHLVEATARRFTMKEVSADMAYLSKDNLASVAAVGAVPFVPFTVTHQNRKEKNMENPSEHWRRMWSYFDLKKEEFLKRYHRRSNVESTFGAIKQKFGESVRSRSIVAAQNEILAKVLLWNLSCIVHAIEEFGVEAEFANLVMR